MDEMCQLYNGKALAGGLPLLSEAAAVYDRVGTERYAGKYMAQLDVMIPKEVLIAGQQLMLKYPVRVSRTPLKAPVQFLKMYYSVLKYRKEIAADLERHIALWKGMF